MRIIKSYTKNIWGWRTKRKLLSFSVDDYGNLRISSKRACENLIKGGVHPQNRFDLYDALESPEDLDRLYHVLRKYRDFKGNHPAFTAFTIMRNIDFHALRDSNYSQYQSELFTTTYSKMDGYENTFDLWEEGISQKIFCPQFHGREHFNIKMFSHLLNIKDRELMLNLENDSYTSITSKPFNNISYTASFDFEDRFEMDELGKIAKEGLEDFQNVFGKRSTMFNSPGGNEHRDLHNVLASSGIKYIDTSTKIVEHQGDSNFKTIYNYLGKKNEHKQLLITRNCSFEPCVPRGFDWIQKTLSQIDVAFRLGKPAIIGSHRANFSGTINESNRELGLSSLDHLIQIVLLRWPDVEFVPSSEIGDIISNSRQ